MGEAKCNVTIALRSLRLYLQIAALKALKLNIRRAKVKTKGSTRVNKFFITDATTAEKIMKSARLEEIRLSILNNLIKYHPESGAELGWGTAAPQDDTNDILHPLGPHKMCVLCPMLCTSVHVVCSWEIPAGLLPMQMECLSFTVGVA